MKPELRIILKNRVSGVSNYFKENPVGVGFVRRNFFWYAGLLPHLVGSSGGVVGRNLCYSYRRGVFKKTSPPALSQRGSILGGSQNG